MTTADDERWMRRALEAAHEAAGAGDVPVGAVVVAGGVALAVERNGREELSDPTAHAEVLALRTAARVLGRWRLDGATLYVTQEPCPMCAGALVNARIARLVYGCDNPKAGAVRTFYQIADDPRLNHRAEVTGGVLAAECGRVLSEFFQRLRQKAASEAPTQPPKNA
jgi:tRNA(adenine34) deaminase